MPYVPNPVNYCRLHGLPAPAWQYTPVPSYYGNKHCSYCGAYTDGTKVDAISNDMRNNAMAMASRNRPEFFLYDCCTDCWSTLQTCTEGSPRARAHWLLVTLRTRYNTTHGRKDGTPKRMLQRRIINLTARAAGKNLPLL